MRSIITSVIVIAFVSGSTIALASTNGGQDREMREVQAAAPKALMTAVNSGQDRNVGSYMVPLVLDEPVANSGQDRNVNGAVGFMSSAVCAN